MITYLRKIKPTIKKHIFMKKHLLILFFGLLIAACGKKATVDYTSDTASDSSNLGKERTYTDLKETHSPDYLVEVSNHGHEVGSPFAFVAQNGDTVIPFGKYSHCWTDTFRTYALVYDEIKTQGPVAIDRNENILFDLYLFDNWPDEVSEGLFRVKRNEKIGYANEHGQVVIPCKYACAFPFENGRAKVTYHCEFKDHDEHCAPESQEWFYIDKKGEKIN
jgi:hypothetical protein